MGARILVVDDSQTIRKVVSKILEASSYEPFTAQDGYQALDVLAAHPIDLVLLDFVMPRMNGYQFCQVLRSKDSLKRVPVVLMSAKGDRIRGQFLQQTGALDAITKPFDARGLIAVVEGALTKHHQGLTRADLDGASPRVRDTDAPGSQPTSSLPPEQDVALRRRQAAEEFAKGLAEIIVPQIVQASGSKLEETVLMRATRKAVTMESMEALTALVRSLDSREDRREVLAGDVSVISISEVLQLLELQRQTGALNIATRSSEVTLYLHKGNLDLVISRGMHDEFLISRYLVQRGWVTRARLEEILADRGGPPMLLGERLVAAGILGPEEIKEALNRQSSELVYEIVRWKSGWFSFVLGATHPAAVQASLGLSTSALAVEGFRRVDEWRLIEGSFRFTDVLYRDNAALMRIGDHAALTRLEQDVLSLIDGRRSVRQVVEASKASSFEACKIIYQFINSRVIRRKDG